MRVEVETKTVVTLQLTKEEAVWLKHVFQNPLTEDETALDCEMRTRFFYVLHEHTSV